MIVANEKSASPGLFSPAHAVCRSLHSLQSHPDMLERILAGSPDFRKLWNTYRSSFVEKTVPAKTVLLREGQTAKNIFFIRKGCLRASIVHHGREITFQFFFENDIVASFESFQSQHPSTIRISSVESTELLVLPKERFESMLKRSPELKDLLLEYVMRRFSDYSKLFLSYLCDTPRERYRRLAEEHPDILQRVPLHLIASYLGITPVSLSRIRKSI